MGMPGTRCPGKESAAENKPPDQSGKGEKAGQEPAGSWSNPLRLCKPLPEQDQIGDEPLLAAFESRVLVA